MRRMTSAMSGFLMFAPLSDSCMAVQTCLGSLHHGQEEILLVQIPTHLIMTPATSWNLIVPTDPQVGSSHASHHIFSKQPQLVGSQVAALGALTEKVVQPVPPELPVCQQHLLQ
jgi:hypothetical protein